MLKKEEEKNKVGRPKLADTKLKKKSIIMVVISLVFALCLVMAGTFSLFGGVSSSKLKGSSTLDPTDFKVRIKWPKNPKEKLKISIVESGSKVNYLEVLTRKCYDYSCGEKYTFVKRNEEVNLNYDFKTDNVNKFYIALLLHGKYLHSPNALRVKEFAVINTKKEYANNKSLYQVKYEKTYDSYVTKQRHKSKNDKCELNIKGGNKLTYNVSCKNGAKLKDGFVDLGRTNAVYRRVVNIDDNNMSGSYTPILTSYKTYAWGKITYADSEGDLFNIWPKPVIIDNTKEYKNECLNSGIKNAKTTCEKYRYHIMWDSTMCRTYAYKENNDTQLGIRCDSNARPLSAILYEYDSSKKEIIKPVTYDLNFVRNYGYWNKKFTFSNMGKLEKGKTYKFVVVYNYQDRTDGKHSWDSKTISEKRDIASVVFKYGDNSLKSFDEQAKARSKNDYYGTNEFQKKMTNDDRCTITGNKKDKNINYQIKCAKNAVPGSLRLVTKYKYSKHGAAYKNNITVKHKSTYDDGKIVTKEDTRKDNGGVIRTLFGTEAKQNKAKSAYGMSEKGTIIGVEDAYEYTLLLYYGFKNPDTKISTRPLIRTSVVVK